jgi:hypothetical protein
VSTPYPGATFRPCANHSGDMSAHLGLVLHVQEGENDLGPEFNDPNSQASYTWVAYEDGHLDQFVDSDTIAWAQAAGNGTYNSVGTQGFSTVGLTEACCQAIAGLYRWGHDTYGWPYVLAETPGDLGFGWHGMGGVDWGDHPNCPGDLRKAQRQHILDLAQGVDEMTPQESQMLAELHQQLVVNAVGSDGSGAGWALEKLLEQVTALQAEVAALKVAQAPSAADIAAALATHVSIH